MSEKEVLLRAYFCPSYSSVARQRDLEWLGTGSRRIWMGLGLDIEKEMHVPRPRQHLSPGAHFLLRMRSQAHSN